MADLETASNGHGYNNTNNSSCSAAKVVDAGKGNNNNSKERISVADAAAETRKTRAAAAALLQLLSRSGTAMGSSFLTRRERNTHRKESAVPILNARTKKVTGQGPLLRTYVPCPNF
jgi:hypothetical protein